VNPVYEPSRSSDFGRMSNVKDRHTRDLYGFLVEIDPGAEASRPYTALAQGGDGTGHRKLGAVGRARWENATFVTGADWKLIPGKPIVMYAGNDRRSGRIWKFVSTGVYQAGMTRAEVRALLDSGELYVSHFADLNNADGQTLAATGQVATEANRGNGRWIHFSTTSTDVPPNAAALGQPNITVGEALRDRDYNGIGGFPNDNIAKKCLFTAAMKLGVMELNRPEDLEWNPLDPSGTPRLYAAFTNHTAQVALNQAGVLYPTAQHGANSPNRGDGVGSVMAIEEADPANPEASTTFTFFTVWRGVQGQGLYDASCPDNVMIDSTGGVWFGTDGNFGRNGTADAVYYLDLDPTHRAGQPNVVNETYGKGFRVAATPSDAEATGPALSPDEKTLFIAVQHPGENFASNASTWPQDR
jgi:secreted PhoX family phosphatase